MSNFAISTRYKIRTLPEDILGDAELPKQITKAFVERAFNGELTHCLG
jgi:hypothetical protein